MNHATHLAKHTTGEAPRLSPLEAIVAWIANLIRTITGMKRRRVFPTNWKDHWEGLRELEWYRDQILAFAAQHVLSGGSLDDHTDFQLTLDVPPNYGSCPRTPKAMNQRFIAMAQFRLKPNTYIFRHIQRIAKREGITLDSALRRDPLRHATKTSRATSPGYAGGGKQLGRLASITCNASGGGGMRVLHAHDGGGLSACARGPPSDCPFPTASDASRLRSRPLAPLPEQAYPPRMITRVALRLKWQAIKRLAPARR